MNLYLVTITYEVNEPIWDSNYTLTFNTIQKTDAFNMEGEYATPIQIHTWESEIQNRYPKWKRVRVVSFSKYEGIADYSNDLDEELEQKRKERENK